MDFIDNLWMLFAGHWQEARADLDRLRTSLVVFAIMIVGVLAIMWGMNISGPRGQELLIIPFILGGLLILAKFTQLRMIFLALIAGAAAHGLQRKNIAEGAVWGVQMLYRLGIGLLLAFWVAGGFLYLFSFQDAPGTFWGMFVSGAILAAAAANFETKSKIGQKVIFGFFSIMFVVCFLKSCFAPTAEERAEKAALKAAQQQQQSQPLQYHSMTGVPEQLFNAAAQTAGATPTTGELYVRNGECSTMNIPEGKWLDYTFPTGYVRAEIQTTYGGPWLPQQNNGNTVAVRWCGEGKVTWTIRS